MDSSDVVPEQKAPSFFKKMYGRYGKWTNKVGSAIVDQAFFAGSNFLLNILLARWLPDVEYGAFVVAYSWFLLLLSFYDAIVIEPMSLYGAGKYKEKLRNYLGLVYIGHLGTTLIIAGILAIGAVVAAIFDSSLMASAMLGTAVAAPFILMRWLTRQPFYILSTPQYSALGGIVYLIANISSIGLLYMAGGLTAFSALVAVAFASFASSMVLTVFFIKPIFNYDDPEMTPRQVIADHRAYGVWSSLTRVMTWLSSNFGYLIIPMLIGLGGTAALRAILNLTMPLFMVNSAIISLLVPNFVRTYERSGKSALDRRVLMITGLSSAFTLSYALGVVLFGKPVLSMVYDGKYDSYITTEFLIAIALLPVITTCTQILIAALRSMGLVKFTFMARIVPTILMVILDILFVSAFGIIGVPIESVMTALLSLGIIFWFYQYRSRDSKTDLDDSKKPLKTTEAVA